MPFLRSDLRVWLAITLFLVPLRSGSATLPEGDEAWARRAENVDGQLAHPAQIEVAIVAYRQVVATEPSHPEGRWKLLRALHYAIDFTSLSEERKHSFTVEAIALARSAEAILDSVEHSDSDRARLYFWSAVAFGVRARNVGPLTIVREGIAGRMHQYALRSMALDATVDRGGAQRLLSRLHASVPRLPLISGWVDRSQILPLARQAVELDTAHLGNRLILAQALLEQSSERSAEARRMLKQITATEPGHNNRVEYLAIQRQARVKLGEIVGVKP